jgi:hypothetical protein
MEKTSLVRKVYSSVEYPKVVQTKFTELVSAPVPQVEDVLTVDKFFEYYEQLFFEIPVNGEINSHEYLIKRSSEYVGGSVLSDSEKALIEEINSLRQQLLEANQNKVSSLGK